MIQGITISKLFLLLIAVCLSLLFLNVSNKKNKKTYMILSLVPIIAFFMFTDYEQEQAVLSNEIDWITKVIESEYSFNEIEIKRMNKDDEKKHFTLQTENGQYILGIDKGQLKVIEEVNGEHLRGRRNVLDSLRALGISEESLFYESDVSYEVESGASQLKITLLNHAVTTIKDTNEENTIVYLDKDRQTEKHE